jgi:hypothetical protein
MVSKGVIAPDLWFPYRETAWLLHPAAPKKPPRNAFLRA